MVYSYHAPSQLRAGAGQSELALATSGGVTEAGPAVRPRFFSGLLTEPVVAAAGMLAVARVARARYVTSPSVVRLLRDPMVTSNGDRLRWRVRDTRRSPLRIRRGDRGSAIGLLRPDPSQAADGVVPEGDRFPVWLGIVSACCGRPSRLA